MFGGSARIPAAGDRRVAEVLLDSDVIIEWLRGHEPFVQQVSTLLDEHAALFWTPVSVAEIYAGIRKGEEGVVADLFVLLEHVSVTLDVGKKAGHYLKAYSKSHSVELGDALIAACAASAGLKLWTLNKKHYPMKEVDFYSPS